MLPPNVGGLEPFERSFDFAKLPNLQEVDFEVHWVSGTLLWIPIALSTLGPSATPRLSVIRLELARSPAFDRPTETLIKFLGNDLRRLADEVARIELGFKGGVKLTVIRGPGFEEASNALDVSFRFCGSRFVISPVLIHSPQILQQYR